MNTEIRFPALKHLLSAYFHEDWGVDDRTPDDVLNRYASDASRDDRDRCCREIEAILSTDMNEADLSKLLFQLGSYYRTSADSLTGRSWLVASRYLSGLLISAARINGSAIKTPIAGRLAS